MIGGIGTRSALGARSLVEMRQQLDDLQRQLATGKKADTYAGVGLDRGLLVGLRNRVSLIDGFNSTIVTVGVRLDLAQSALGRLADIGSAVKAAAFKAPQVENDGSTIAQMAAYSSMGELLGLLNTKVGDRYIFSGSGATQPSVATIEQIMDGDGARAGFKQVVAERRQADLGADGRGRLAISAPTTTSVQVMEDVAGSPFGFKLAAIDSSLANVTVSGPGGSPPRVAIDLSGLPNAGETVRLHLTLPDGTSEIVTLTATASTTPGANAFSIGATADDTAANLQSAITTEIETRAATALTAASAVAAGDNFFNGTPQRVAGPPFASATALVAGTPADTVAWYTGEDGAAPARSTATARVDSSITVSYGLRANEEGLRWMLQNVATLAAVTYTPSDPNAGAAAAALHGRVAGNLDAPPGMQTIQTIQAELAGAQATLKSASERHSQTKTTLSGMMEQIEGVSNEDVAAKILAMQVRLQGSLQTTSLMYRISLVNYL